MSVKTLVESKVHLSKIEKNKMDNFSQADQNNKTEQYFTYRESIYFRNVIILIEVEIQKCLITCILYSLRPA